MSSVNPFQIPSCFQIDAEKRRRERFKKTVVAIIIGCVLMLVGLLIEGCENERAGTKVVPPAAERHSILMQARASGHFHAVQNLNSRMDMDV
ncbi:MAG TPA: hypothetical protein VGI03_05210 [Verrucomicrobiae bacterium]